MRGRTGVCGANKMVGVVILAGGNGTRYGGQKQFEDLNGRMILEYALDLYDDFETVVVLPEGVNGGVIKIVEEHGAAWCYHDTTRMSSLKSAFEYISECEYVLIADAVRIFTPRRIIDELIWALDEGYAGAFPALPAYETVVESDTETIIDVLDRDKLWFLQTPEACRVDVLEEIVRRVRKEDPGYSLSYFIQKYGLGEARIVEGDMQNFKITYRTDVDRASATLGVEYAI